MTEQKINITFKIDGEPVAKGRPKFANINGFTRAYTPKKTSNYEDKVKQTYISKGYPKLNGYIESTIYAYFPILKTYKGKKINNKVREQMLNGEIRPDKKPDLDNIAKIILDSLNGVAYDDDSQVVNIQMEKYYAEEPNVLVFLSEV